MLSDKTKNIYLYLFALIFPFWAWIASIRFFKSPSAMNLFWYGCAFMGFVFIFNPIGGSTSDSSRIANELIVMHNNPIDFNTVSSYFYSQDGNLDIYQSLLCFITSIFTNNPHILFFNHALIFGFFYSRNIWIIFKFSENSKIDFSIWIVIIMTILINPIWEINGGRMWLALHVFMYGLFSFFLSNNKMKAIWCFLSIFIHFSFIIPLMLFFISLFVPKRNLTFYFVLYLVASSIKEIDFKWLNEFLMNNVPDLLSRKVESYMSEEYKETLNDVKQYLSSYLFVTAKMAKAFVILVLIFIWKCKNELLREERYRQLLFLFLFFGSIFEILSSIQSMGRFLKIPNMIFYSLLLLMLFDNSLQLHSIQKLIKYLIILLFLPILLAIRIGFYYYGTSLFWSNFIASFFIEDRTPLINYVKQLFE